MSRIPPRIPPRIRMGRLIALAIVGSTSIAGCNQSSTIESRQATPAALDPATVTCASFAYQEDAQQFFGQHYLATLDRLDADEDGIACNELPRRSGRTVPLSQTSATASTAEGLWIGTTSTGRAMTGIILDNGKYWFLYSGVNHDTRIAGAISGAISGTGRALNGSFSSTDGIDLDLENRRISGANLSASYHEKRILNGTAMIPDANRTFSFSAGYGASNEQSPGPATLSGVYLGRWGGVRSSEFATVTISTTGVINGVGTSGCKLEGSVRPRTRGDLYDVSVTVGGDLCAVDVGAVVGIGYLDALNRRFSVVAFEGSRTSGFIFAGNRP